MASPPSYDATTSQHLAPIGGAYTVDCTQDLFEWGGGQPCFAVTDHRHGRRDLMAVQAAANAPARALPISRLTQVTIENMLLPLAHGRAPAAPAAQAAQACFVIMPRPPGPPLSRPSAPPMPAWSERELLDCALRPLALALDHLAKTGTTHRAIRPNNVFRARPGQALVLGGAWASPPAMAQNCVSEPPYSAMCHPAGRGEGDIADDIYALGVLLLTLATGAEPMAGMDDAAIIRCKLERGSFQALAGNLTLSPTISDLLKSMLAEDPEHRPPPALLADPYAARSRRLFTRPRSRAQRPLDLGGTAVWDVRTLANAMHHAPALAIKHLRMAAIDTWLRRALGEPVLAARLDDIVRGRDDDPVGERTRSDSMLLMRAIAVLDPLAPLCWRGVAFFPDGIGPLLAQAHAEAPLRETIEAIVEDEVCGHWGEARPSKCDVAMLRLDCRQHRILVRTNGWAGGAARLAYALNPALPCRSPFIAHEAVLRLHELLPALERRIGAGPVPDFLIDPESAAFIAARFNGRMDSDFAILAQHEDPDIDPPGHRGLAQLQILGRIVEQEPEHRWPALAAIALRPARAALSQWKGRTSRAEREGALDAAAKAGSIPAMLAVLFNEEARAEDAAAARSGLLELQRIENEIKNLVEGQQWRWSRARNTGYEVAAGLGMIALAGAAMFRVLP